MKAIKNLLKFVTFIFLTMFLVLKFGNVFILEKPSATTMNVFHDFKKNSLDVVIVGNSSIMRAVSPMELWESDGIASYNYAISGGMVHAIYYWIQDVLKTQKPKLIIIDPVTFFYKTDVSEEFKRTFIDYINFDVKLKIINDKTYANSLFDKASILFPILRYHDRWKELDLSALKNLNKKYENPYRGFAFSAAIKPNYSGNQYMEKSKDDVEMIDLYKDYLYKIIDLCKKNDVKLLILGVQDIRVWGPKESEIMNKIAKETGVDFLDLNSIDYGLNWLTDTKDGGGHLNTSGSLKVTAYLRDYIKEHYDIPSRKGQKGYEFWDEDYKKYKEFKEYILNLFDERVKKLGLDNDNQDNKK